MSQPSLELTLEVNIFERLERLTEANLGTLTRLRIKSRSERINLLFIAYQERVISAHNAQEIAQELGISAQHAPWIRETSAPHFQKTTEHVWSRQTAPQRPAHSTKPTRRFSERASLTEALHNATHPTPPQTPSPSQGRSPKRSFAETNLKTEIEIKN